MIQNEWYVTQHWSVVYDLFTERHDALYVVGALDEAMELRGMRYHPIDIETSVIRAHKSIMEWYVLPTTHKTLNQYISGAKSLTELTPNLN